MRMIIRSSTLPMQMKWLVSMWTQKLHATTCLWGVPEQRKREIRTEALICEAAIGSEPQSNAMTVTRPLSRSAVPHGAGRAHISLGRCPLRG